MTVSVRYYAQISGWLNCREEILPVAEVPGQAVTARQVLAELAARHGGAFAGRIYDPAADSLHDDVFILINGCHLARLRYLDTAVKDQDFFAVIPVAEAG